MVSGCNEMIICFWRKYQLFVFFSNQKISVIVLFQQFRYNWKNSFPEIKSESIGKNSVSSKWKQIVVSSKSEKQIFFSRNQIRTVFLPCLPPLSHCLQSCWLLVKILHFFSYFLRQKCEIGKPVNHRPRWLEVDHVSTFGSVINLQKEVFQHFFFNRCSWQYWW